jgi:hypothetical protein
VLGILQPIITAPTGSPITVWLRELKREKNPKSQTLNLKQIQNSNVQNSKHMPVAKRKEAFLYSFYLILYSEPEEPASCHLIPDTLVPLAPRHTKVEELKS